MKFAALICWTVFFVASVRGQSQVQIDPKSQPAVDELSAIADAIKECPRELKSERQWGKNPNEIERWYIGPPQNVVWDVERARSVRSPYMGYIEFALEYKQWVPDEVKGKYQDRFGLDSVLLSQGPTKHRYEFDIGPGGLNLSRMLYGKKADQDESADDSCWQKSARAARRTSRSATFQSSALHDDFSQPQPEKPDAIGGKHYSKAECVHIARWVTADEKRLKSLTGIEVGNFWYTLDSCGTLYFSDWNTMGTPSSTDQLDLEIATDWATHEYIDRLESAISRLPRAERQKIADDLKGIARPAEGRPIWSSAN